MLLGGLRYYPKVLGSNIGLDLVCIQRENSISFHSPNKKTPLIVRHDFLIAPSCPVILENITVAFYREIPHLSWSSNVNAVYTEYDMFLPLAQQH